MSRRRRNSPGHIRCDEGWGDAQRGDSPRYSIENDSHCYIQETSPCANLSGSRCPPSGCRLPLRSPWSVSGSDMGGLTRRPGLRPRSATSLRRRRERHRQRARPTRRAPDRRRVRTPGRRRSRRRGRPDHPPHLLPGDRRDGRPSCTPRTLPGALTSRGKDQPAEMSRAPSRRCST